MITPVLIEQLQQAQLKFQVLDDELNNGYKIIGGTDLIVSVDPVHGELGIYENEFRIIHTENTWQALSEFCIIGASKQLDEVVSLTINFYGFNVDFLISDLETGLIKLQDFGLLSVPQQQKRIVVKSDKRFPALDITSYHEHISALASLNNDSIFDFSITYIENEFRLCKIEGNDERVIHSTATFKELADIVIGLAI